MARAATATRRATTALRVRPLKYRRLFEKLIGRDKTRELIKTGHVVISVDCPYVPKRGLAPGPRRFELQLAGYAVLGYCISPKFTHAMKGEVIRRGTKELAYMSKDQIEYQLSMLYPKVLLLVTDPAKFLRTAG